MKAEVNFLGDVKETDHQWFILEKSTIFTENKKCVS